MKTPRVEVVLNIPSPYRIHFLEMFNTCLRNRGIDCHVNFMAENDPDRPKSWARPDMEIPHTYWKSCGISTHHLNLGLVLYLLRSKPDVIICGTIFDTFTALLIEGVCCAKIKCGWAEGNTKTPGVLHGWKAFVKHWALSRFDHLAVPGSDGVRWVQLHQSLTRRKMPIPLLLPNLVDENRFKPRLKWSPDEIVKARKVMECDADDKICLIPARLLPVKGLVEFIRLLNPDSLSGWKIRIVGEGPLRGKIQSEIICKKLECVIQIVEPVDYSTMPSLYAAADLFLLPSLYDQNPLSVIEAIHTGLPIALTRMAGNVEEGVSEGKNGWVLHVDDEIAFRGELDAVFRTGLDKLHEFGAYSLKHIAPFWYTKPAVERFVDSLVQAGLGL